MMLLKSPLGFLVGVMLFAWVVMCEIGISSWFWRSCGGCSRRGCSGGGCSGSRRASFLLWEMDGNLNIAKFLYGNYG